MTTKGLRDSWRFMLDHAGYATPPGRAQCALELARAERDARRNDWSLRWDYDPDACTLTEEQAERVNSGETLYLVAWIEDAAGTYLASLGGVEVESTTDPYMRVVFAELASEALAALRAEQAEEAGMHIEVRP